MFKKVEFEKMFKKAEAEAQSTWRAICLSDDGVCELIAKLYIYDDGDIKPMIDYEYVNYRSNAIPMEYAGYIGIIDLTDRKYRSWDADDWYSEYDGEITEEVWENSINEIIDSDPFSLIDVDDAYEQYTEMFEDYDEE